MALNALLKAANDLLAKLNESANCQHKRVTCVSKATELTNAAAALEVQVQEITEERSRPGLVRSILVAVDNSEQAQWAVDEAVRLAEALEAKVSLLHVVDVMPVAAPELAFDVAMSRPALVHESQAMLQNLVGLIPDELRGKQIIRHGKADKEIVLAAQEAHADLLVIGTHGRGPLGRFLLGSVAESVVRHARCPVLTVGHTRKGVAPELYSVQAVEVASEMAKQI
ncbi:MAG TPA: universal stress protein [Tepidisphaeraceae bacterium]|jgi:universal stress protein A